MMAGNETARRRRGQRRTSGTGEASSTSRTVSDQQPLQHHHDHHHHHYHFHHHYHHFPRPSNRNQEQGLLLSSPSGGSFGAQSQESSSDASHSNRRRSINRRPSLLSSLFSAITSREAASGGGDHTIDETLGTSAAVQSHRPGFRESFLDDFNLLFEDEEDGWSEDELMGLGIQEWLAAVHYGEEEGPPSALSEQGGLSKSLIRRLPKEVYAPKQTNEEVLRGSSLPEEQQEDCSVCLERFALGQQLICLPCKHRFHPDCVTPWLESHGKCPYCRARVRVEGGGAGAAIASVGGSGLSSSSSSSTSRSGSARSLVEDDLIAWMEAVDSGLSQFRIR